jgi:Uma2 family endonuclease
MNSYTLNLDSIQLTDEQIFQLCINNRNLRFERNANGDLIIMPPTGGEAGHRNIEIAYQLQAWSRQNNLGIAFDSSTGFKLSNGADRSPDAAWLTMERWNSMTPQQQQRFVPLCPDFAIELRSPSDSLKSIQEKMEEYRENGTQLGWLMNLQDQQLEVYRTGQGVEVLESPSTLSGEEVLPGFILELQAIW